MVGFLTWACHHLCPLVGPGGVCEPRWMEVVGCGEHLSLFVAIHCHLWPFVFLVCLGIQWWL